MTRSNKYILGFTAFFSIIFILRVGLVYSYPNDQIWTHYILWLKDLNLKEDLFYYSESWKKSLWYLILFEIRDLTKLDPLIFYYLFQLSNIFLFFYILFKIFNHFNATINVEKYLYFGLLISCTNFWISGSLANFHEIGFNYRSSPFILGLFSFYFFLKNRINSSLILLTIGSLMHLPVIVPFYLISILYLKKFNKINLFLLSISSIITISFILGNIELNNSIYSSDLSKALIKLRINYIFIENWSFDSTIRYFSPYFFLLSMYFYSKNIEIKKFIILLISIHLFYMITVLITNDLPTFSVFRFGRELFIIVFFIFIIFLNLTLTNLVLNFAFFIAIFSQFIFGSFSIFMILSILIYFSQSQTEKERIAMNIYKSMYKNYFKSL